MALFGMRFDFRVPEFAPGTMADRYEAAIDMAAWADRLGFVLVNLSEHHGSPDGYLPSPLPMAAAMAARTQQIRFKIAAMVSSFHDPLRLAEDMAVVDLISRGRLDVVIANGYVESEFAMFDQPLEGRVRRTTETVATLKAAWTGEPFEHRGRTVQVTPRPFQPGGPQVALGGSSEGAARRAARIADDFLPSSPELWDFYRDELVALGKPDPGPAPGFSTAVLHLASDPDEGWAEIAPYAMHETNAYGATMQAAGIGDTGGYQVVEDPDVLRDSGAYRVVTPAELVAELDAQGPFSFVMLHPLLGGTPPDIAWTSLRLLEDEVLPRLAS